MPVVTSQLFLDLLGIKMGKPFRLKGDKYNLYRVTTLHPYQGKDLVVQVVNRYNVKIPYMWADCMKLGDLIDREVEEE